jgi:hypothetical protein
MHKVRNSITSSRAIARATQLVMLLLDLGVTCTYFFFVDSVTEPEDPELAYTWQLILRGPLACI